MTEIENTLNLINTRLGQLHQMYGGYSFKKAPKKQWIELYEYHTRELTYLFTIDEVNRAYNKALEAFSQFAQINAKFRKK